MTSDIYDSEGNRIGVMTVAGPSFSMSPEDLAAVRGASERAEAARAEELRKASREGREQRMARLLDIAEVHPSMMIDRLDQLTFEERKLIQYALQGGDSVNLPYAVSNVLKTREKQGHKRHAVEVAIDRASRRLYNRGLATVETRDDGLVWVTVSRERLLDALRRELTSSRPPGEQDFNLMKVPCEIPTNDPPSPSEKESGRRKALRDPAAIPPSVTGDRLGAVRLLKGIKGEMSQADMADVQWRFSRYNDDVSEKIILLSDLRSGEILGSEYSTRFNDLRKAAASLSKYDWAVEQSLQENFHAVFLTLTTDPKMHGSNWEANRSFGIAWNKFLSFLTRRKGRRPQYIASYEFQKNGLLHVHALIFVPYLIPKDDITKAWSRIGQGSINWIYRLRNVVGRGGVREWRWTALTRPKDAKGMSGGDYLKKYLKKTVLAMTDGYEDPSAIQCMYWAVNKRFWSCSRAFLPPKDAEDAPASQTSYGFAGVIPSEDAGMVDRMIYRRLSADRDAACAEGDGR